MPRNGLYVSYQWTEICCLNISILERFSDLAVFEFGGFLVWQFLGLAVVKIDLFSDFIEIWGFFVLFFSCFICIKIGKYVFLNNRLA